MKIIISFWLFISVQIVFGQDTFKPDLLDSILLRQKTGEISIDESAVKIFEAIDRNINSIVDSLIRYQQLKYTIIERTQTEIRNVLDKRKTLDLILKDTMYFNYLDYWKRYNNDTSKFLKDYANKNEFKLFYDEVYLSQLTMKIDPLKIKQNLGLKNILFFSKDLNLKIDSISKKLKLKDKEKLYKYLSENYDYFSIEEKTLKSKSIRILYIVVGNSNYDYAGIDIYGSHYLLTFDRRKNMKVVLTKELWVY